MGRRANGDGTIFKRKDGRWSAQVYVTLSDGTRKRVCITKKDRESVRVKLRELLEREHQRIPYSDKEWRVGDYLDYWLSDVQSTNLRETSISEYARLIRTYLRPAVGGYILGTLNVRDVREALKSMRANGCPVASLRKCLQILTTCLNCAMREELIFRNVAHIVEKPKYTPKETVIWTAEQAVHFLRVARDHTHYIAFLLCLTYGLRRGEVLGLRYADIDFESGLIHIRQQIDRINGKIKARDLKTKNSRRTLPLTDEVHAALLAHAAKTNATMPPFSPDYTLSTEGTVLVSSASTPLEPRRLDRCFQDLQQAAGLPRIKLHAMRHMAATFLKDANTPVRDAQLILGHANSATTMNIYQHGTTSAHRAALTAVEERLHSTA